MVRYRYRTVNPIPHLSEKKSSREILILKLEKKKHRFGELIPSDTGHDRTKKK